MLSTILSEVNIPTVKCFFFCHILNEIFFMCYKNHKNLQSESAMSILFGFGFWVHNWADSRFGFGLPKMLLAREKIHH